MSVRVISCRNCPWRTTSALPPIADANPRGDIEKVLCSKPVDRADSIKACFPPPLSPCLLSEYRRLSADFGGAFFVPLLNFLLSIEPHSRLRDVLAPGVTIQYGTTKNMTIGTVKFFNQTRGFGFISPEDGTKDVFVHVTAVEQAGMGSLAEGQKVAFDIQPDDRGPKAVNLQEA